jgi:hypothetical protein
LFFFLFLAPRLLYEKTYGWVALALPKKMKPLKPRPSPPPSKMYLTQEKLASESHAGDKFVFPIFD